MKVKDRYSGFQTMCAQLNQTACHFFCLLSIAEEERERLGFDKPEIDLIEAIRISMSKGWLRSDMYVLSCFDILSFYTGKSWTRRQVEKLPSVINGNEYTECNYYWKRKEGLKTVETEHFTRRGFDTLENSATKKNGKLRYYYIYTCKE